MRFKTIAFALIVSCAVFILGCDDEDSSTIGGGGRISLQVTVNPPLDSHTVSGGTYAGGLGSTGDNFTPATGFTTDEYSVTKGQNVTVVVSCSRAVPIPVPFPPTKCANVRVKTMLNGSVFDDRTYNMGYHLDPSTPDPCGDANYQQFNLIIP